MGLLAKAGREDDERPYLLLRGKHFHGIGAKCGGYRQDGKVCIGYLLHVGKGRHALHFRLFGIHGTKFAGISATNQVLQDGTAGLVYIIGRSHHHDAGGTEQLACYHSLFTLS